MCCCYLYILPSKWCHLLCPHGGVLQYSLSDLATLRYFTVFVVMYGYMYLAWYQVTPLYTCYLSLLFIVLAFTDLELFALAFTGSSFLQYTFGVCYFWMTPLLVTYRLEETDGLEVTPTQDLRAVSF